MVTFLFHMETFKELKKGNTNVNKIFSSITSAYIGFCHRTLICMTTEIINFNFAFVLEQLSSFNSL